MTAVCYRAGIMAADSIGWTGENSNIKVPVCPKIFRLKDGGLVGCGGATSEIQVFRIAMMRDADTGPYCLRKFEKEHNFSAIRIQPDGTIWQCNWQLNWFQHHSQFVAMGANTDFLWGAMFAGASAEQAVRLAIEHTDGAGGEVQVERLAAGDPGGIVEVRAGETVSQAAQRVYAANRQEISAEYNR